MKVLSIRQPWAWMILHAGKDIENRSWRTNFRGQVLIHASKGMTRHEYLQGCSWSNAYGNKQVPAFDDLTRGGIVGSVEIVDCVEFSPSSWFQGPWGFVLRDPQALPFIPCRGRLGFFDAPTEALP